MKNNIYEIINTIGETTDSTKLIIKYVPYEEAIIIEDEGNKQEIWLKPDCLDYMIEDLTQFNEYVKFIKEN